jgi:hypothetical protein
LREHTIINEERNSYNPLTLDISLTNEEKLYKREVYSLLSMVSDIGGLYDGLLLVTSVLVISYNASMFELTAAKLLFRFQKKRANTF